ncbi:MAG: DNA polymerase III subunit gamma/tau [Desulfomonile sp.]
MSSYLVLARKYRPTTFTEVVGQDHVITTLKNAILSGRVAHAFLFCGVRGVGKTTVARVLAKSLNCTGRTSVDADPCCVCTSCKEITAGYSVDVREIDGASHTSVDNIRDINENIKYPPVSSNYKIIIIDEVHMISMNAFNALLKTLEEPPPHAKFIFATTESHKVPATINSRCQRFNFRTISVRDISLGMADILRKEEIESSPEALDMIAREAQGSFRDALSLLDQVIAFADGGIEVATVQSILGIGSREIFFHILEAMINRKPSAALEALHQVFDQGYDPEQFTLDLIRFLRNLILVSHDTNDDHLLDMIDVTESELDSLRKMVGTTTPEDLSNLFSILLKSEAEIKKSSIPVVALEMTIIKMCMAPRLVDLSSLLNKINSRGTGHSPGMDSGRGKIPTLPVSRMKTLEKTDSDLCSDSILIRSSEHGNHPRPETKAERFTITDIRPVPSGAPGEVWETLKKTMQERGLDGLVLSMLDHGQLISYGPNEVEIGFTKSFYRDQFESYLKTKPELNAVIESIFGAVQTKVLVLSTKTSLKEEKHYSETLDGQSDMHRAMRKEAMENLIVREALKVFENSSIEEVRIISN